MANVFSGVKGAVSIPLPERFWPKVDVMGVDECWPWKASQDGRGYGQIFHNGKLRRATQVSWELENGKPFPQGMDACHTCDNPRCVNPKHIWPGTKSQNAMDSVRKGRATAPKINPSTVRAMGRTHCRNGHPYSVGNLSFDAEGRRRCRACKAETYKRWLRLNKRKSRARVAPLTDGANDDRR